MINLRRSFDSTLKKYGHNILLQRRYNPHGGNPQEEDEEPGFTTKLELWTVRHTFPNNISLPGIQKEVLEGVIHEVEMYYYFSHDAVPREGDRIYENVERYPDELSSWLIDFALPMQGNKGRIEFWHCGVTRELPT